ncbi:MAG TPA: peptide ABC transporter substrate-binding protein [Pyrinomonadaceae bacterium]|jgi:ABC-type oligopeptide transport system substrate-binding subunit|nr:peptide ABC transporter substrate-binding protein [Pyrinomonadaceae bacterium]
MTGRKRKINRRRLERWRTGISVALLVVLSVTGGGCFLDQEVEPYYGRVVVPRSQEFRWIDGGLPQTFDPALAAAPPDTDAVRAIFEGLTEYDPRTLAPLPGVATRWESSPDNRVWTFYLRQDARWSNGEPVTASDFVNSWQRILQMGERAPHARLLENIAGAMPRGAAVEAPAAAAAASAVSPATVAPPAAESASPAQHRAEEGNSAKRVAKKEEKTEPPPPPPPFGAEAIESHVLRVRLQEPDKNFPSLVAHPVFRPVHNLNATEANPAEASRLVSNGAFQLVRAGRDGVVLERAANYWDARGVNLQRVQFIETRDTESALGAYHAGEVDAVTNAGFEPLALKLLAPYKDFRRATYGALTYYSFNTEHAPFDDVRVREALAISIDRERISEDKMEGATEPAKKFLPVQLSADASSPAGGTDQTPSIEHNVARARSLMAKAGFPDGENFPRIRLLINRNDQQRTVAQAVAAMWKNTLGVETDLIIKSWDEYEAAVRAGDFDVVRRGVVMQTLDEVTNMRIIFDPESSPVAGVAEPGKNGQATEPSAEAERSGGGDKQHADARPPAQERSPLLTAPRVMTEEQALRELPAFPIYFASSYSLVKPYVAGFDANLLDAPSLKNVRIDTSWQPPKSKPVAWLR